MNFFSSGWELGRVLEAGERGKAMAAVVRCFLVRVNDFFLRSMPFMNVNEKRYSWQQLSKCVCTK